MKFVVLDAPHAYLQPGLKDSAESVHRLRTISHRSGCAWVAGARTASERSPAVAITWPRARVHLSRAAAMARGVRHLVLPRPPSPSLQTSSTTKMHRSPKTAPCADTDTVLAAGPRAGGRGRRATRVRLCAAHAHRSARKRVAAALGRSARAASNQPRVRRRLQPRGLGVAHRRGQRLVSAYVQSRSFSLWE